MRRPTKEEEQDEDPDAITPAPPGFENADFYDESPLSSPSTGMNAMPPRSTPKSMPLSEAHGRLGDLTKSPSTGKYAAPPRLTYKWEPLREAITKQGGPTNRPGVNTDGIIKFFQKPSVAVSYTHLTLPTKRIV